MKLVRYGTVQEFGLIDEACCEAAKRGKILSHRPVIPAVFGFKSLSCRGMLKLVE